MSVVSRFVAFSCSFWLKIYSESTLYMSFKQTFGKKVSLLKSVDSS